MVFDSVAYDVLILQKAAYRLMRDVVVDFLVDGNCIRCEICPTINAVHSLEESIENFKKEALDQQLRMRIQSETELVRNLILATAFSNTNLV